MDYYGIDVYKRYGVLTCMNEQGQVLRRVRVANTPEALAEAIAPSGSLAKAVLEATANWGYVYDVLEPWVGEVVLAHLLRADLIPAAYIPPREIRDQRDWLRSRTAVVWMATQIKNGIHALLAKNGLSPPLTDLFGRGGRVWLEALQLRPVHRQILDRYLRILDCLEADIKETTAAVAREAQRDCRARLCRRQLEAPPGRRQRQRLSPRSHSSLCCLHAGCPPS